MNIAKKYQQLVIVATCIALQTAAVAALAKSPIYAIIWSAVQAVASYIIGKVQRRPGEDHAGTP